MLEHEPKVHTRWWALRSYLLLAGLSILVSCDQPDQLHRPTQHPKTDPASTVSAESEPILVRICLLKSNEVWIRCSLGGLKLRDVEHKKPIRYFDGKTDLFIRRKNGSWICLDSPDQPENRGKILSAKQLEVNPVGAGFLTIGSSTGNAYRGSLRLVSLNPNRFALINRVELENYLAGVVGSEMPASWDRAALQAQTIACRTYVLYEMHSTRGKKLWDVTNDQRSQVYSGIAKEHRRIDQALRDTRGIVLTYGPFGQEKIFPSFFSSICGGHTQDSVALIPQSLEPLQPKRCPYCRLSGAKYFHWPEFSVNKTVLTQRLIKEFPRLQALGHIVGIESLEQSDYGRIEKIQLIGSTGKAATLKAETFRLAVSTRQKPLRSSWYRLIDEGSHWRFIQGHGWGHGVGLCQYGCYQMARQGSDCAEILDFYYPQSRLVRAY